MFKIIKKEVLNSTVTKMTILAPLVAKKAEPGQFVILRVDNNGERIPLTVAGYDRAAGTVDVVFQIIGATTNLLNHKLAGEYISDFVGPLGNATHTENIKKVCIVAGGVGSAIAYPVAKKLHDLGAEVTTIVGFRNKDLVIFEEEFSAVSDKFYKMSDDGSWGTQGVVTAPLKDILSTGERYDMVLTIGPLIMMKFVTMTTKPFAQKTVASMNPIMIDGTGMCGGCRLSVTDESGNKITKFACVDGPEFDAFSVDFDEVMNRNRSYSKFEQTAREKTCNLYKSEVR